LAADVIPPALEKLMLDDADGVSERWAYVDIVLLPASAYPESKPKSGGSAA
jgi:hypothetical protein